MPGGFTNKPKILRGAFVEYGLSVPRLFVGFQFNPEQLTRNRSLTISSPGGTSRRESLHQTEEDLLKIQECQQIDVQEESINFDIRLDATDELDQGDPVATEFGIAPLLTTLEMMVLPTEERFGSALLGGELGSEGGFSFTRNPNPPLVLFIWGRTRKLPVNINSLNITETQFDTMLNPVRATASVSLTVIEGPNSYYSSTKPYKTVTSNSSLANITDIADVVIPG